VRSYPLRIEKMLANVFVPKTFAVQEEDIKRRNASDKLYPARMRDMKVGCVEGADGSAYLSLGDTVVYCSVYGPRFKLGSAGVSDFGCLECEVRALDTQVFASDNKHVSSPLLESQLSQQLKDALDPSIRLSSYPKMTITIHAVIISGCDCDVAALITCASVALADAAIELNDLVTAATVRVFDEEVNDKSSNPSFIGELRRKAVTQPSLVTISTMTKMNQLTSISVGGRISSHGLSSSLVQAVSTCQQLRMDLEERVKLT
jgi:exosome complex component MTR3